MVGRLIRNGVPLDSLTTVTAECPTCENDAEMVLFGDGRAACSLCGTPRVGRSTTSSRTTDSPRRRVQPGGSVTLLQARSSAVRPSAIREWVTRVLRLWARLRAFARSPT